MVQGNILIFSSPKTTSSSSRIFRRIIGGSMPFLFSMIVVLSLFVGWRLRPYHLITAERGLGWALGLMGVVLMLVLLIYPLRKRCPDLHFLGSVKAWFRLHMMLGILGPVCILFHANFQLGSLNSNVALFSMLTVSASGIIGRYIYTRIHYGLYGHHATLLEFQKEFEHQKDELTPQFALVPGIQETLFPFAQGLLTPAGSLWEGTRRVLTARWMAWRMCWKMRRLIRVYLLSYAQKHGWSHFRLHSMRRQMQRKVGQFLAQTVKVGEFSFYERLFALWHILHVPLACVLAIAVVIHIIAVQIY